MSRESFAKVFLKHKLPIDPTVPGPGTYTHKIDVGKDGEKYTMRMKTSTYIFLNDA